MVLKNEHSTGGSREKHSIYTHISKPHTNTPSKSDINIKNWKKEKKKPRKCVSSLSNPVEMGMGTTSYSNNVL